MSLPLGYWAMQLDLAPRQVPLLGNSVAVGVASLLHIALAALAVAFMVLSPAAEAIGLRRPHYADMARTFSRFTLVTYTTSIVLAVIMVELFIGLFPVMNAWLFNRFRYPIFVAMAAFLLQLLLLYPYYHYWDRLRRWSVKAHLAMGAGAAGLMLVWVGVLDGIASFMLTPVSGSGRWEELLNPSWVPLVLHRFIGDFVVAGYVTVGYAAWRLGRREDAAAREYYLQLRRVGLIVGATALLLQPVTGLVYATVLQQTVPEAYQQLVAGPYQPLVHLQFTLLALLFVGTQLWLQSADRDRLGWVAVAVGLLAAGTMVGAVGHPDIRRAMTFLLVGLVGWALYRAWHAFGQGQDPVAHPFIRGLGVGLALVALLTYLTMGTIRSTARRPYTVWKVISLEEEAAERRAMPDDD